MASRLFRLFRLLLLFAVFHHAVALPGVPQAGVAAGAASEHAVMHWQDVPHHHHDDGAVHQHGLEQDGQVATQHLHIDSGLNSPALMAEASSATLLALRHEPLAARADAEPASACLAQPDRPPRRPTC